MGFLEIAAAIASIGYTGWKLYKVIASILEAKKMTKWQIISRIVNGAVTSVYEDFVRDAKEKNGNGKLLTDQKAKARGMAYDRILDELQKHNLKLDTLRPNELMDLIEDSVTGKQARASVIGKGTNHA